MLKRSCHCYRARALMDQAPSPPDLYDLDRSGWGRICSCTMLHLLEPTAGSWHPERAAAGPLAGDAGQAADAG